MPAPRIGSCASSRRPGLFFGSSASQSRKKVTAIAAGAYHGVALLSDGSLATWGFNGVGKLGDGTAVNRTTPVVPVGMTSATQVTSISAAQYHTLALTGTGAFYGWGYNNSGQIGNGSTAKDIVPTGAKETPALAGKTLISPFGGAEHSSVLCQDGTIAN